MKESGYALLRHGSEKNLSTLAMAKLILDTMTTGKKIIEKDDRKKRLVQGEVRKLIDHQSR